MSAASQTKLTTWWGGYLVEVEIGEVIDKFGGEFYDAVYLDGRKKGQALVIPVEHMRPYPLNKSH